MNFVVSNKDCSGGTKTCGSHQADACQNTVEDFGNFCFWDERRKFAKTETGKSKYVTYGEIELRKVIIYSKLKQKKLNTVIGMVSIF